MIIQGDCLEELKKIKDMSVDLVYLDPPFFTQKKQTLKNRDNSKEYSFDDIWPDIQSYKEYIQIRLVECRRVLTDTGSIFLHCDKAASHYLRLALDESFGADNFQSEIIWSYRRWSNAKKGLLNSHQVIFFYSKTKTFKFNHVYTTYSPTTNIDQIFQKRARNMHGKTEYKKTEAGNNELIELKNGVPLSDVWEIPYLNPKAKERVGYPTQKPILLLERIIELASDPEDTVLDPFCGSGTTLVAAKILGRKYIGIDKSLDAVSLTNSRLLNPIKTESNLLKKGKARYLNQAKDILDILKTIDAEVVQRNRAIDGFLRVNGKMLPIPVRVQRISEDLEQVKELLKQASKKGGFKNAVLIKNNISTTRAVLNDEVIFADGMFVIDNIKDVLEIKKTLI